MFEISRRDLVLSASGAYIAFGLNRPVAFIDAAHARQPASPSFRKYKVGEIEVISLVDGILELPPRVDFIRNAGVEQVKAELRANGLPDDRVPFPFTALAIKQRDQVILIDAGTGGYPIYGPQCGWLLQSMAAAGLDAKDVKTIVISHFHGDHIYGLMDKTTNAQVFPHAEIIVPAAELKWWLRPEVDAMNLGPSRKGLSQLIRATLANWKNVRPVDGEVELLPGIWTISAFGHSPAQVTHLLSSHGQELLATADVSLLPALFVKNPDWQTILDQDGPTAVETRRRIFDRAVADKLMVTGVHWLQPSVGTIARDGNSYAFVPSAE